MTTKTKNQEIVDTSTSRVSILSEVLSASISGAISSTILYPLEVIKTKLQAVDNNTTNTTCTAAAVRNEEEEEQKFDEERRQEEQRRSNKRTRIRTTQEGRHYHHHHHHHDDDDEVLYLGPQQQQKQELQQQLSMIPYAINLYKREGSIFVFFRGVEASALQSSIEKALYFFAYTTLKNIHKTLTNSNGKLDTITNLILGYVAEWAHLPITLPIDAWTTKIQTTTTTTTSQDTTTPMKVLLTMLSDKNQSFYKGISAYYLLCFKPAIQYTVYEQIKTAIIARRRRRQNRNFSNRTETSSSSASSLSTLEAFVLGMFARTVATILVFPFIRAKVLMQTQKNQKKKKKNKSNNDNVDDDEKGVEDDDEEEGFSKKTSSSPSLIDILLSQYQLGGISSLYIGLGPELTRGILSAGLSLAIKERIPIIIQKMILLYKQTSSSSSS